MSTQTMSEQKQSFINFCQSFPDDEVCTLSTQQIPTTTPVVPPTDAIQLGLPWWLIVVAPIAVVFAALQKVTEKQQPYMIPTTVFHGVADLPSYEDPKPVKLPVVAVAPHPVNAAPQAQVRGDRPAASHQTTTVRGESATTVVNEQAETLSPSFTTATIAPFDIAGYMADNLGPTLVTATPRTGKGVILSRFWRLAKQKGCSVWVLQPKPSDKELGYWQGCDRFLPIMLENYDIDSLDVAQQIRDFVMEWRSQQHRPTVLIIDEMVKIQACQPKLYEWLKSQVLVEMSSGETDDRFIYLVTQSPLVGDIGLSGGNRAILNLVALARKDKSEHLNSLCKSLRSVPKPDSNLYRHSKSPKPSVVYHSSLNRWYPMPCYDVPDSDPALVEFMAWHQENNGQVTFTQFKNSNRFRNFTRSRAEYDRLSKIVAQ